MMKNNPSFNSILRCEIKTYKKRLQSCQRKICTESVHKLRISLRRLLVLIALIHYLAPQTELSKPQKRLKRQLDDLDEMRDIQVMQETLESEMPSLMEIEPFLKHLQKRQLYLIKQVGKRITGSAKRKIHRKINQAIKSADVGLRGCELKAEIITYMDVLYQTVLQRYQRVDPAYPASIHSLRIALKKFRYTLLLTHSLIPPLPVQHLKRLQSHLNAMGNIQNSTVLQNQVHHFFLENPPPQVKHYLQNRQQQLIENYMSQCTEVFKFWPVYGS